MQDADSPRLGSRPSAGELSLAEDVLSDRRDRSFYGRLTVPAAFGGPDTPIRLYVSDTGDVRLTVGPSAAYAEVWTTAAGVDALVEALAGLRGQAPHAWENKP